MILFGQHSGEQAAAALDFQLQRLSGLVADMQLVRQGASPEAMASGEAPILNRWVLAQRPVPCLAGLSIGHPRLAGVNRAITTSDLWLMSEDRVWARTLSRWYRLGRPAVHPGNHS